MKEKEELVTRELELSIQADTSRQTIRKHCYWMLQRNSRTLNLRDGESLSAVALFIKENVVLTET